MAKFTLGNEQKVTTHIQKSTVGYLVDMSIPDEVKDTLPMDEVAKINGIFLLRFYSDVMPLDRIEYNGYQFRVTERIFYPTRYHSTKELKRVPLLLTEYLGEVSNDTF